MRDEDDTAYVNLVAAKASIPDNATFAPLNIVERNTSPSSPSTNDLYLDDGTNTASGEPNFFRYDGSQWEELISATDGGGVGELPYSRVINATDTLLLTDVVVGVNAVSNTTITLPTAVGNKDKLFVIKRLPADNGGRQVTVEAQVSETIDGFDSINLTERTSLQLLSTGFEWIIL